MPDYFTRDDVFYSSQHLVVWHYKVYDVSLHQNCPFLGNTLLKYSCKDISHILDVNSTLYKVYNPLNGIKSDSIEGVCVAINGEKWWETIQPIGSISQNDNYLEIYNHLTLTSEIKLVCAEHSIKKVLENYDLSCLAVKYGNTYMDIDKSISDNGITFCVDLPKLYLIYVEQ